MSSMLRGGGTNDFPRMEMVVCFASSSVICFGAHPKNAPDIITIKKNDMQKIGIERRLSIFSRIEWRGQQVFLTSIILHLIREEWWLNGDFGWQNNYLKSEYGWREYHRIIALAICRMILKLSNTSKLLQISSGYHSLTSVGPYMSNPNGKRVPAISPVIEAVQRNCNPS